MNKYEIGWSYTFGPTSASIRSESEGATEEEAIQKLVEKKSKEFHVSRHRINVNMIRQISKS